MQCVGVNSDDNVRPVLDLSSSSSSFPSSLLFLFLRSLSSVVSLSSLSFQTFLFISLPSLFFLPISLDVRGITCEKIFKSPTLAADVDLKFLSQVGDDLGIRRPDRGSGVGRGGLSHPSRLWRLREHCDLFQLCTGQLQTHFDEF
jgi:hypothetical protein